MYTATELVKIIFLSGIVVTASTVAILFFYFLFHSLAGWILRKNG